jgi:hypothetical protein
MKKLISILLILTGVNVFVIIPALIPPVTESSVRSYQDDRVGRVLTLLGCPKSTLLSIRDGVKIASDRTGIEGVLIVSLLYTESNFDHKAKSKKGYQGLMQTPTATGIPLIDICHGADILKEKLHLAKGNIFKALTLYKGGNNHVARKQAQYVLLVYKTVKRNIV